MFMLIGCSVLSAQQKNSAAQTVTFAVLRVNSVAATMTGPALPAQSGLQTNRKVTISFGAKTAEHPPVALTVRQPRSLFTVSSDVLHRSSPSLKKARPLITVTD